ncbi:MAG: UDP-N-acetylmuramoyl-tripeptide--D-alanyl-D-alanine ligase [Prolixibacteraceae bacterium]|jgi:UDP-N-acetylmuramoyl-tripeptide--D-alanyl-D-alanine ligase|nr:UDP-N-acetylmuramoyl-tripeptide--D-alanyl-D-alanine ligase [Prolixibacteraceae bacterium]
MITIEELYKLFKKHQIVFTDSRQSENGGLFFALKGENFDGNKFALKAIADGADYAVVDQKELKSETNCILVDDVLQTLQKLANYHRNQFDHPILAITGTNGKTTTKELLASVLSQKYNVLATKGNFNNHIGVPLTLLSIKDEHDFALIEMGANHPGEIEFLCKIAEPDYGLITNVGKAHLEGFGSFEGVKKTKGEMYKFIAQHGLGVFINTDNAHLLSMINPKMVQYTYASEDQKAELKGEPDRNDVFVVAKVLFAKGWLYLKSNLTGSYNFENILAAARIGVFFGIDPLLIQKGIEKYVPANNRSQLVTKGSTAVLVDCYNANPSSMEVSIKNFIEINRQNKLLILGDMLELGDDAIVEHQKVVSQIQNSAIKDVVLIGTNFKETNVPVFFKKFDSINEYINQLQTEEFDNRFVLLKGSRGIQLEKLLDKL